MTRDKARALEVVGRLQERAEDGSFTLSFDKRAGELTFSCKRATAHVLGVESGVNFPKALMLLFYQAEKYEAMVEARRAENDR